MKRKPPCVTCTEHLASCTKACGRYWLWRCFRDYELRQQKKAYQILDKEGEK